MKVLLVHNLYQQAGGEDAVVNAEAAMLRQAGHQVTVWLRDNAKLQPQTTLDKIQLGLNTVWSRQTTRELKAVLRQDRPDLVHFHNTFPQVSPAAYYACKDHGIPVVQTLHNYRLACPGATLFREGKICEECVGRTPWNSLRHRCYRSSRSATAAVYSMLMFHRYLDTWSNMVDRYIALSVFARSKFMAAGLPARKLAIKPNFLPADPGRGESQRQNYAVFIGRLSEEKGLETILEAWRIIRGRCHLRIVGDGPLRARIESVIAREKLSEVSLEGRLPSGQVLTLLKSAQFLLFPSECFENFPMAIAEAFACGTPVLASRIGSVQEIVQDGYSGIHVTPGEPRDWAEKVLQARENPEDLHRMAMNARIEYETRYTAEINHQLLMQIYSQATNEASHC